MLYKQGTQRIEIYVRKDISGEIQGNQTKDIEDSGAESGRDNRATISDARKKRIIVTNATHAFSTFKQVAGLALEFYVSGLGARNGDQAMQDQVNRDVERFEDTANFASNVARGAVFGKWGGAVGIAVGMATAAAASGASLLSKYGTREREYNYKVFKENNAIEYNRARAGINLTNGRLR